METMSGNEISQEIKAKLTQIEQRENIRILYACESGSRAWGFASPDSDYDVRFIYVRPLSDYLKVKTVPDFLECELNEVYDINGWDLKKFFKQLYKSNPVIFEWANSPIVYRETPEWERIKAVMNDYVLQVEMLHHYRGMGRRNCLLAISANEKDKLSRNPSCEDLGRALRGSTGEVVLKKYLYVLRPVLACLWLMQKHTVPPTEFSKLVEEVLPVELKVLVDELLAVKMKSGEKEKGARIPQIDSFIETKLNEATVFPVSKEEQEDYEKVDNLFLEIVQQGK